MFRRISLAYVALAMAGVALLSALAPVPAPVPLSELGDHVGEEVAVEALVVGAEGDLSVLWQDGHTVRAYGRSGLRPGDVVSIRGRVLEGQSVYLQIDRCRALRTIAPVGPQQAADGLWVTCEGTLRPAGDGWAVVQGPMAVPVEFRTDVTPVDGIAVGATGVWYGGSLQVHDRDGISCDRFADAPWAVPSDVSFQGLVEREPWGSSMSVATIDGSVRAVCEGHEAHMGDLVEVAGAIEYDPSSCRFSVIGSATVLWAHGPFHIDGSTLAEEAWRYENAAVALVGNVTAGPEGPALVSGGVAVPLRGNVTAGFGKVEGRLVLEGLRYVVETGQHTAG